jgi:hypothetical protein
MKNIIISYFEVISMIKENNSAIIDIDSQTHMCYDLYIDLIYVKGAAAI